MYSNLLNAGLCHLCHPHDVISDDALDVFGVLNRSSGSGKPCAPLAVSAISSPCTNESAVPIQTRRPTRYLPVLQPAFQKGNSPLPVTFYQVEYLPAILPTASLEELSPLIDYDGHEEDDDVVSVASSSSSSTTLSVLSLKPISIRSHRTFSINTCESQSPYPSPPPLSPSSTSSSSDHSDDGDCTTDRQRKRLDALAILEGRANQAVKPKTSFTSFSTDQKTKRFGFLA